MNRNVSKKINFSKYPDGKSNNLKLNISKNFKTRLNIIKHFKTL